MRTTITLGDELLARAQEFTGVTETSVIVRKALKALVEREAARRLARLGGIAPNSSYRARPGGPESLFTTVPQPP